MQKVVDIRFKKNGKGFTFLVGDLDLKLGDNVVVETQRGIELGEVCKGIYEVSDNEEHAKVLRKATKEDVEKAEKLLEKRESVWETADSYIKN